MHRDDIEDKLKDAKTAGENWAKQGTERTEKSLAELNKDVADFKEASGIDLKNYERWRMNPKKMGEIVKLIVNGGTEGIEIRMQELSKTADKLSADIRKSLETIKP